MAEKTPPPKPDILGSGGAQKAGSVLAGRRKQLDELEKASMADGAFGMRKRGNRRVVKRAGWPWD